MASLLRQVIDSISPLLGRTRSQTGQQRPAAAQDTADTAQVSSASANFIRASDEKSSASPFTPTMKQDVSRALEFPEEADPLDGSDSSSLPQSKSHPSQSKDGTIPHKDVEFAERVELLANSGFGMRDLEEMKIALNLRDRSGAVGVLDSLVWAEVKRRSLPYEDTVDGRDWHDSFRFALIVALGNLPCNKVKTAPIAAVDQRISSSGFNPNEIVARGKLALHLVPKFPEMPKDARVMLEAWIESIELHEMRKDVKDQSMILGLIASRASQVRTDLGSKVNVLANLCFKFCHSREPLVAEYSWSSIQDQDFDLNTLFDQLRSYYATTRSTVDPFKDLFGLVLDAKSDFAIHQEKWYAYQSLVQKTVGHTFPGNFWLDAFWESLGQVGQKMLKAQDPKLSPPFAVDSANLLTWGKMIRTAVLGKFNVENSNRSVALALGGQEEASLFVVEERKNSSPKPFGCFGCGSPSHPYDKCMSAVRSEDGKVWIRTNDRFKWSIPHAIPADFPKNLIWTRSGSFPPPVEFPTLGASVSGHSKSRTWTKPKPPNTKASDESR